LLRALHGVPSHVGVRAHVAGHVSLNSSGAAFLIEIGAKFPIGPKWEQTGNTKEYVDRERPECRVYWDQECLWIDVEGTDGVVQVRKYVGKRWADSGAF
jgi:hypothetical protein